MESTTFSFGANNRTFANTMTMNILYPTRKNVIFAMEYPAGARREDPKRKALIVSQDLREDLRLAKKYIVVYSYGTFDDDFGRHWFKYCGWIPLADLDAMLGDYASGNCALYNDTGDFPKN
jgi:hypothetical protein